MELTLALVLGAVLVVAVAESALVPLPMTVLMAPAVYEFPEAAVWFAAVATVGSAVGSVGGTYLGRWRGKDVLLRFVDESTFEWSADAYANHGRFGLLLAAVSPLPYIPFTICSGIYGTRYLTVLQIAVVGRGIKYSMEVAALLWLTSIDPTRAFVSLGAALAVGYVVWNYALRDLVRGRLGSTR